MCRSIKQLYNLDPICTDEDIQKAARQFVRKITNMRNPSQLNLPAYECAISDIASIIKSLFDSLETKSPKKVR